MELSILDATGLPDGSIISVRSGPTRRQSPLPCTAPFKLPPGPWPLRIDVLGLLGKSSGGAKLGKLDAEGCCKVPLDARDGRQMSVTLQVFEGKSAGSRPKTAPVPSNGNGRKDLDEPDAEANPASPVKRRDTEAEARAYLDTHRLHEFMHALFELLLRERPADPYSFIAQRFLDAANLEKKNMVPAIDAYKIEKLPHPSAGLRAASPDVLRSSVSTAPSINKEPSLPLPNGALPVTIRSLRGRSLARLTAQPSEKIQDVKTKIQTCLGVPVSSQALLWWAETLPNDTTLEDHDIPAGGSVHLVCSTRNPRVHRLLSGSSDGGLKLWNLDDGELVRDFSGGDRMKAQKVQAVAVDWNGMRAVSGSYSGCLHVWQINTDEEPSVMEGHTEEVNALEAHWPTMRALSGSSDSSARLWDLESKSCVHNMEAGAAVYSLAVEWSKNQAFGGLSNGTIRMWDLGHGTCIRDIETGASTAKAAGTTVSAVAIDPVGHRAVNGLEDGHLIYWHIESGADTSSAAAPVPATKKLLAHYTAVRTIVTKWVDSGSRALCGSDDGSLSMWRLDSSECLARFARHIGMVWAVYADWSCERAVSGAFDGCLKLWDLRTGDCLRTLQGHSRPVRSVSAG